MWKVAKILILILFISCGRLPSSNSDIAFAAYIARLKSIVSFSSTSEANPTPNTPSNPTTPPVVGSTPKIISLDFVAKESLAPVIISKTQTLGVTFDTEMEPVGCNVNVNGIPILGTATASTDKLTLSFKPNTSWGISQTGLSLELSTNCKSTLGAPYVSSTIVTVYILDSLIYVDSIAGNDGNPGTMQSPMQSLSVAVNAASTACGGTLVCGVLMKGGIYQITTSVIVPSNISIYGGFNPTDWRIRRADKTTLAPYDTIINDTSTGVTGTVSNPYGTIKFSSNTGTNVLDGIIINEAVSATPGNYISPIAISNAQSGAIIYIRNTIAKDTSASPNVISSGLMSYNNGGSIYISNSQALASTVVTSPSERHGIYYNSSAVGSTLSINTADINAGYSTVNSSGILTTVGTNGTLTLTNNTITGATCNACDSIGVTANFATVNGMTISQNTINAGSGSNSYGINITNGNGLTVNNNVITTSSGTSGSSGIVTGAAVSNPTFSNNTITSGLSNGAGGSTAILLLNSTGTHTLTANTLTAGQCTLVSCKSVGIQITNATSMNASNNIITGGACAGNTCSSAGVHITGNTTSHTLTGNTITSGTCNTSSCITAGIFDNGQANLSLTNSNISSGTCTGSNCDTRGYYLSHAYSSLSNVVTFSNNTITSGNCTGGSCKAFGFSTTNSSAASITYNFTGNTISSGNANLQASGINVAFNNATMAMTNNTITSGTAPTTWGINNAFSTGTTLTGNTISVGSCTGGCTQIGLRQAANASLTMTGNTIDSGTSSGSTTTRIAFSLDLWSGSSSIQRNTFLNSTGLGNLTTVNIPSANTAALKFCSNVLIGGGRTDVGAATTLSIAKLTNVSFLGNTIIGASVSSGTTSVVSFTDNTASSHTNLKLDQNIISGYSAGMSANTICVNESSSNITYSSLQLNNVDNCSSGSGALYNDFGSVKTMICAGNFNSAGCTATLAGITTVANNSNLAPVFVNSSTNDFHLNPSTPIGISQGVTAPDITVFNTACGNSFDRDGNTRVAGNPMGAYK